MKVLKLIAAFAILLSVGSASATAVKQYPVRDFFRNPEQSFFRLSEDGRYLSFMKPWKDRQNIYVQEIGSTKPPKRITSETARDISGYFWKGSNRLLYEKDFGGDENFHVVSVDRNGKGLRDLTPFEKTRSAVQDDLKDISKDEILVSSNKRDKTVFDVYRVNILTGQTTLVAQNPGNIVNWIADHNGKVRAAVTSDGTNTSLLYRASEAGPFKTVLTTSFRESTDPLFFTFDNKKLYVSSNINRDKRAITILDPETGKEDQVLFEHPAVDVSALSYSQTRKVLTRIDWIDAKPEHKFLDAQTEALYTSLRSKLPGYEIILQANSDDEQRWIVAAFNDRTEGSRYLFDAKTGMLTKLADLNSVLEESNMAEMKPIQFIARDGVKLNGYLSLPVGRDPKNIPLIVNPHGGPWARDEWGFKPEVQFLANRGYAVLQVNFRGSTGYGRKFWELSFRQWGRSMQDDITDGVQWAIEQGIADPKRIAIYGGSYGGYATLAGVAFTPDLYAAAVDYVGISNLLSFMNTNPPYWEPLRKQFYEMVGDPEKDGDLLRAESPLFHADQIKTPLFVAQGKNDPRVNKSESDQIVDALRKRGVKVEYMVKDNEGHGFQNQENQFDFYEAMEKFLGQHLRDKTLPTTSG